MKFATYLVMFASAASSVLAQNYYVTAPVADTKFTAGANAELQWIPAQAPTLPGAAKIVIDLVDGSEFNARFLVNIAKDLPASAASYTWAIPMALDDKTDYFLRMAAIDATGRKVYNYSARFTITGGTGYVAPEGSSGAVSARATATGAGAVALMAAAALL